MANIFEEIVQETKKAKNLFEKNTSSIFESILVENLDERFSNEEDEKETVKEETTDLSEVMDDNIKEETVNEEGLTEEDDEEKEEEEEEGLEDTEDDEADVDVDIDADVSDEEEGEEEMETDDDFETDVDMDSDLGDEEGGYEFDYEPNENGDYDLTNETDPDKVMQFIASQPDDTKIVIVKNSSYDVTTDDNMEGADDEEMDLDMGEEPMDEPLQEEVADYTYDGKLEHGAKKVSQKSQKMAKTMKEGKDELGKGTKKKGDESLKKAKTVKESTEEGSVNKEEQVTEDVTVTEKKLYEMQIANLKEKMRRLQGALKESVETNKALVAENTKAKKLVNEAKNFISEMNLTNTNLAHVTKLLTEHSTTIQEKREIVKSFDERVTTLNESRFLYENWSEKLSPKRKANLQIDPKTLKEGVKNQKADSKQINETVETEEDNMLNENFDRIAGYEI